MEMLEKYKSQIKAIFRPLTDKVKQRVLGNNNENLDLLIDTFSGLDPTQRSLVLGGVSGVVGLSVILAMFLYVFQVNSLRDELEQSFQAFRELKEKSVEYKNVENELSQVVDFVNRKTSNTKFKPFFEKKAQAIGVTLGNLSDKVMNLDPNSPLADKIQEVNISIRLNKVSLPRLMKFLIEIERSDKVLRVKNLKVRELFGTKEYFDANVVFRGYAVL